MPKFLSNHARFGNGYVERKMVNSSNALTKSSCLDVQKHGCGNCRSNKTGFEFLDFYINNELTRWTF